MLEDGQYRRLKERARRQGKSLGQVVRDLLSQGLDTNDDNRGSSDLWAIVGLGQGDGAAVSEDPDRYLYGPRP
jgi:plasmid stability protein